MTQCIHCNRKAIRGQERCQKCERRAMHGPAFKPNCAACRDKGRIDAGGCDIPGCRHFRYCDCSAGKRASDVDAELARRVGVAE